jgi:hypothetical protein
MTEPARQDASTAEQRRASSLPIPDPHHEARRILEMAAQRELTLRVMGGVAIRLRCPAAATPPLMRAYRDIDFAARARDGRALTALFASAGYEADAEFNALHGRHRLFFWDEGHRREADVFLDTFTMCHTFDFRDRLEMNPETLPLADLLLFKLQVMETNEKDYKDAVALLADHSLGPEGLDAAGIARFVANDWGWWRTVTLVLDRVDAYASELPPVERADRARDNIRQLRDTIAAEPKSRRWKLRARVGERKRWYETPEETQHLEETQ